jgi:hypothetical protein
MLLVTLIGVSNDLDFRDISSHLWSLMLIVTIPKIKNELLDKKECKKIIKNNFI